MANRFLLAVKVRYRSSIFNAQTFVSHIPPLKYFTTFSMVTKHIKETTLFRDGFVQRRTRKNSDICITLPHWVNVS